MSLTTIERHADQLLKKFEDQYGLISAPVPIEKIAENLLDLMIEWNEVTENPQEVIFAGLSPRQRKIIFNEKRKKYYEETDGLYNTVLAHEVGHLFLHKDIS